MKRVINVILNFEKWQ